MIVLQMGGFCEYVDHKTVPKIDSRSPGWVGIFYEVGEVEWHTGRQSSGRNFDSRGSKKRNKQVLELTMRSAIVW